MRRFFIVFGQEFRQTLRSKPFIVICVFLLILLLVLLAAGFAVTGFGAEGLTGYDGSAGTVVSEPGTQAYIHDVAVCDRTGGELLRRLEQQLPLYRFRATELDDSGIEALLSGGACEAYIVLDSAEHFDIYEKADIYGLSVGGEISEALTVIGRIDMLEQLGVSSADAQAVLRDGEVWYTVHTVGGYDMGKYVYNYVMVMLMFLVIALYGQMVATTVATEKSSRTMEVLATSVSPAELLCGKVMGVGAAGMLQMSLFIAAAAAIIKGVVQRVPVLSVVAEQLLDISGFDIACLVIYFVLGFMMYAFIYGALGSMVSQIEDLSGVASMPTYLFMIGYLIATLSSMGGESGAMMKISSFVPFWSPVTMFSRMSVEEVPVIEIIISIVILLAAAAATAWMSARIYRSGMLRYGKPPKIKEIINAARNGR